jgi:predicted O-linked N-acetylglucosamine transferase (SPINDLY family)
MLSPQVTRLLAAADDASRAGRLETALDFYGQVIGLDSTLALAHYKRGNVLKSLRRFEEAVASYTLAIELDATYANAYCNRGVVLAELKRFEAALSSYDQAILHNPGDALALYNRSAALRELGRSSEALASLEQAIAINPIYAEAFFNHGTLLQQLGRVTEALASFNRALEIHPDFFEACLARGNLLHQQKAWAASLQSYLRAFELKPDTPFLRGVIHYSRMHICDWTQLAEDIAALTTAIEADEAAATPFDLLSTLNSPRLHHQLAKTFVRTRVRPLESRLPLLVNPSGKPLHIGYFSGDFYDHPVAIQLAEVLETHDRTNFELTAFSHGPNTGDPVRQRMERSFDRFIDVREEADEYVLDLARSLRVDIAVDLSGHTGVGRPRILGSRAAPIQISYLGYAGSMGAEYIDYVIADATVIPRSQFANYSEKVVHLPDSYLPNDRNRAIAAGQHNRTQLRLPPDGFVFCCFNVSSKITPDVFGSWMRILLRTPGSVLWLSQSNATAMRNLQREADARGVDPVRLVFADRTLTAGERLFPPRAYRSGSSSTP